MKDEKRWYPVESKNLQPRLWLRTEREHLLLTWALVSQIRASEDFLAINFLCEIGQVQLSASDSLRELFELMQMERVRLIDGRQLACKIIPLE